MESFWPGHGQSGAKPSAGLFAGAILFITVPSAPTGTFSTPTSCLSSFFICQGPRGKVPRHWAHHLGLAPVVFLFFNVFC